MDNIKLTFPSAWKAPQGNAQLKKHPQDFIVEEELAFTPSGEGEHVFLLIEKRKQNTTWVARQLADSLGISKSKISYAGLKDRHGITRQWFSIHAPGKKPAEVFASEARGITGTNILKAVRHSKKLQRGALKGNHFSIRLQNHEGSKDSTAQQLTTIQTHGVPNYFGYQRFGQHGNNIVNALKMFRNEKKVDRFTRSILLSSARSLIFNNILAERVENNTWNQWQAGDVMTFPDNQSLIFPNRQDESIPERFLKHELLLTAPLWGQGELRSEHKVRSLEHKVASTFPELCQGVEVSGMQQERRSMQLFPKKMTWQWEGDNLLINFSLNKGCYATTLLQEVVNYTDISLID